MMCIRMRFSLCIIHSPLKMSYTFMMGLLIKLKASIKQTIRRINVPDICEWEKEGGEGVLQWRRQRWNESFCPALP